MTKDSVTQEVYRLKMRLPFARSLELSRLSLMTTTCAICRVHFAVSFPSQTLTVRTLLSTNAAAHLAKTPMTSSFPPVL